MNFTLVVFDADGVLIDSKAHSWEAGRRIASLFDWSIKIENQKAYRDHFNKLAQTVAIEEKHISALQSLHRLLMRHNARSIHLFDTVLELAANIVVPRFIVTAALADGTRMTLNKYVGLFKDIIGNETGSKTEILANFRRHEHPIYVTDNIRDVAICRSLAIPVIATGWGYDECDDLAKAGPDYLARSVDELAEIMTSLRLLETKGD